MYCPHLLLPYELTSTIFDVFTHRCNLTVQSNRSRDCCVSVPVRFKHMAKTRQYLVLIFPSARKSWTAAALNILCSSGWDAWIVCSCSCIKLFLPTRQQKKNRSSLFLCPPAVGWHSWLPGFSAVTLLSLDSFIPLLHLTSASCLIKVKWCNFASSLLDVLSVLHTDQSQNQALIRTWLVTISVTFFAPACQIHRRQYVHSCTILKIL